MPAPAFRRSAHLHLDPCASSQQRLPPASGRFCTPAPEAAGWLYAPDDCARHRLALGRRRAFAACLNVFHPGRFTAAATHVLLRRSLEIAAGAAPARGRLAGCGHCHLRIDGRLALHGELEAGQEVDWSALLGPGRHSIAVILDTVGEPPCLWLDCGPLRSDAGWEASSDS